MTQNPYQPGIVSDTFSKTRATRWLVWTGIGALCLAVLCMLMTVATMFMAFNEVANATTPQPSQLASGISRASFPTMAAGPLAILGILLIVAGLLKRQPVEKPSRFDS